MSFVLQSIQHGGYVKTLLENPPIRSLTTTKEISDAKRVDAACAARMTAAIAGRELWRAIPAPEPIAHETHQTHEGEIIDV